MSRENGWNSSTLVVSERKPAKNCPGTSIVGAKIPIASRSFNQLGRVRSRGPKSGRSSDAILVQSLIDRGIQKVLKTTNHKEKEATRSEGSSTSQDSLSDKLTDDRTPSNPTSHFAIAKETEKESSADSPALASITTNESIVAAEHVCLLSPEASETSSDNSTRVVNETLTSAENEPQISAVPQICESFHDQDLSSPISFRVPSSAGSNHSPECIAIEDLDEESAVERLSRLSRTVSAKQASRTITPDTQPRQKTDAVVRATSGNCKYDELEASTTKHALTHQLLFKSVHRAQSCFRSYARVLKVASISLLLLVTCSVVRYEMTSQARFCGALPT